MLIFAELVSCSAQKLPSSHTQLVGGHLATAEMFPATIYIPSVYCGAAKIGAHLFLTAAHCIEDHRDLFGEGTSLSIQFGVTRQQSNHLTVTRAETHPSYQTDADMTTVTDLGLIWVKEDTSSIQIAHVASTALQVGAPVLLSGYGCVWDEFAGGIPKPEPVGLKSVRQEITKVSSLYFETALKNNSGELGRICPGDSGTPVYQDDGQAPFLTIVGVNSFRQPPAIWSALSSLVSPQAKSWLETMMR